MSYLRLFFSTAIFVAIAMALALWLLPLVVGRFPLTSTGFALAFNTINWFVVVVVATVFGSLRVLSEFELFNWLSSLFYWIDVFLKAFR